MVASHFVLLNLALATFGSAQSEPSRISFPIRRKALTRTLHKRDDNVGLINETSLEYVLQLQIGTPAQSVDVLLDTGSDELWVNPTCSTAGSISSTEFCQQYAGNYDPTQSSSSQELQNKTTIQYGQGDASIQYYIDDIVVTGSNSSALKDVTFGVASNTTYSDVGIVGVGWGNGYNLGYNNLVDELAAQGVTASKAFSVALGSVDANNAGVIVFGGVDTKKFTGKLTQFKNLDPQPESDGKGNIELGPYRYWVNISAVGITKPGSTQSTPYDASASTLPPVFLDSGSTISTLPKKIVSGLASDFGSSDGGKTVDCSYRSQNGTVDFTFGKLTINVPYGEFIREYTPGSCALGAEGSDAAGSGILGDSFMRSAYVVFDQTNADIYLAQYVDCGSNEQTLAADKGAAGNFAGECGAASSSGGSGPDGSSPSPTSSGSGASTPSSTGKSPAWKLAVPNAAALVALAVAVQILMFTL